MFVHNLVPRWGAEFRAVVDSNHKYVHFRNAPDLLFNLASNPNDTDDLSEADAAADVEERLARLAGEKIDFDEAEQQRIGDQIADEEFALSIPKGAGNAYLFRTVAS